MDRAAVFVNNVATHGASRYKPVYSFLEASGETVTVAELAPFYKQVHVLSGDQASELAFTNKLRDLQKDDSVGAIDVFLSLHGSPESLWFVQGERKVADLARQVILDRSLACRAKGVTNVTCEQLRASKLRIVYSAACHARHHAVWWHAAGFAAAAGARAVHTDSAASYPTFLGAWKHGYDFAWSVNRANSADAGHRFDNWARPDFPEANSTRDAFAAPLVSLAEVDIARRMQSPAYLYCAEEGAVCQTSDRVDVWYGASKAIWRYNMPRDFPCDNATLGDPAPGERKLCMVTRSTSLPGHEFCAREGQRCAFTGTKTIVYGAAGKFATKQATQGIDCKNSEFGDPAPGIAKSCYVRP